MNMNRRIWEKVYQPPVKALKKIGGGRLKGMTDINPQWRMEAATELWGPCGVGWKYDIKKLWLEPVATGEVLAFALVDVYYRDGDDWSLPVPGIGGSMMVANETKKEEQPDGSIKHTPRPYASDECFKMAVTDALSVAFKALGFGADIYAGRFDGSKYLDIPEATPSRPRTKVTHDVQQKLNSLPKDVFDGLKLLVWSVTEVAALCEQNEWDNAKIKAATSAELDKRNV
jgi:hypothetical protein